MKNIYAHTGPTPKEGYVGYISVNQRESGIEVSVRSEGNPAPLGVITLSPEQCEHLATDLLAHINQEPPAKPDQQAQAGCDYCNNPMFAGFKCDNCGRKPEQQAQAGEPEVVAWRYYLEKGQGPLHHAQEENAKMFSFDGTAEPLITLQSHREAMAAKEREHEIRVSMLGQDVAAHIAKKDAALKACALPKSYVSSTLASDPTGGASILFCFSDTKDAEEWHAAITQAEGAMK